MSHGEDIHFGVKVKNVYFSFVLALTGKGWSSSYSPITTLFYVNLYRSCYVNCA